MVLLDPSLGLGMAHTWALPDTLSWATSQLLDSGHHLAQMIEDPDIIGKFQKSWRNFIESGQVWALGIGFVLGYMFRTFTGG